MPDSTTKATVNQKIPSKDITDFERVFLKKCGFSSNEHIGYDYFFAEDGTHEIDDDEYIDLELINTARNAPGNEAYFDKSGNFIASESGIDHDFVFQNIVARSEELEFIEIEGAYTASRMIIGEFGGFATLITANNVISKGTSQFLREAHAELARAADDEKPPITQAPDADSPSDYEMKTDGGSAWIGVGDNASIYIRPDGEALKIDVFPRGGEGQNPIDSIHVYYSDIDALNERNNADNEAIDAVNEHQGSDSRPTTQAAPALIEEMLTFHRNGKEQLLAMVTLEIDSTMMSSLSTQELFEEGIKEWVSTTEDGQAAWDNSDGDLNIGDIMHDETNQSLLDILKSKGIHSMDINTINIGDAISYDHVFAPDDSGMSPS